MKLNDNSLFKQQCYLSGVWSDANNKLTTSISNPSNNEIIGSVPQMGDTETLQAIETANIAFGQWKKQTAADRAKVLRKWYELIVENCDDLATILTTEQGKPFNEAKGEVMYAASFVEWFSEEAKRAYGDIVPSHKSDAKILLSKEPIGVVAAITPWNFPAAMVTRKCAPAFAAGCAVVLKPAPETPFTAFALAELATRAGLPKGLFSVITGDAREIGKTLTDSKVIRKLSFTGSTNVGKILMRQCAETVKKLALELGGNAPFIVFSDADIDKAIQGTMDAKFRNAGQTCVCANRIYVHDTIYDTYVEKLLLKVKQLKVGDGFLPGSEIGPLINDAAIDKVKLLINDAVKKGAVVKHGQFPEPGSRLFIPHLLTEMSDDMLLTSTEAFGPVAPIYRFSSDDEVISRANNSDSGLCAYVYTKELARAMRLSDALEVGIVGINEGLISTPVAPFGGVKESGLGREGSYIGMEEFMEIKYTLLGGL